VTEARQGANGGLHGNCQAAVPEAYVVDQGLKDPDLNDQAPTATRGHRHL